MPTQPSPPATQPASTRRRGVIDVGSNSVKLLVADVSTEPSHAGVLPVLEKGSQTRLGEGAFASGQLSPTAIERTTAVIAQFQEEALHWGVQELRVIATAAAREARNADALHDAILARTGMALEILDGATEAEWGFQGVCTRPELAHGPVLVSDLGGGSTEFIVGRDGHRRFSRSFPLGAVRLLESLNIPQDPAPTDLQRCREAVSAFIAREVQPAVEPSLRNAQSDGAAARHVGVGGTVMVLARMEAGLTDFDRARIEAQRLDLPTLTRWVERLWALPLAERRRIPGLPPERADVILTGSVVHEQILEQLGLSALFPSTRGLRFAALLKANVP